MEVLQEDTHSIWWMAEWEGRTRKLFLIVKIQHSAHAQSRVECIDFYCSNRSRIYLEIRYYYLIRKIDSYKMSWYQIRTIECNLNINIIFVEKNGFLSQKDISKSCQKPVPSQHARSIPCKGWRCYIGTRYDFFHSSKTWAEKPEPCRAGSGGNLGGDRKRVWIEGEGIKIIRTLGLMIHRVDEMTCDVTWKMMLSFSLVDD